ncbi:MAG: putative membrane protein [Arenicella sp.]
MKRLDLPEKTPQLYEELLPFAIALDLETQWSDQFTEVLAAANWDSAENSNRTHWYSGDNRSSMGSFAPAIAAGLATSVVAASTPPSSSSSGGGGGFSGGGGGGGGGGGW